MNAAVRLPAIAHQLNVLVHVASVLEQIGCHVLSTYGSAVRTDPLVQIRTADAVLLLACLDRVPQDEWRSIANGPLRGVRWLSCEIFWRPAPPPTETPA